MTTIFKPEKLYISPYLNDIENLSTKEAVAYLKGKGEKIWQIVKTLNKERSVIYYHLKGAKKKQADSLALSHKRAIAKNINLSKLSLDQYIELIKTNGKFICKFSGEEINITSDKWAVNSCGPKPYIYLKRYTYLEVLGDKLESISKRHLESLGYTVTKEKPAF